MAPSAVQSSRVTETIEQLLRQGWERCQSYVEHSHFDIFGINCSPHLGHSILSESMRRISSGGFEYPHFWQVVFSEASSLARLIFSLRGIGDFYQPSRRGNGTEVVLSAELV
jgi:hypothetical protein